MALASTGNSIRRIRIAALILSFVGLVLAVSPMRVSAQTPPAYRESPTMALDRHIRVLATSPKDFLALIGAGKAALELGDTHAAISFFGRADEVFPRSPLPQAGMGAAMVSDGDAAGAMRYFERARQLGATAAMIGADRGLAYDLLGRHSDAQADYRAALVGRDADEARRRLALSLAITGDHAGALETLAPLVARGDMGAFRSRALVLALSGDLQGARRSLDAVMPGSSVRMAPFFAKLPSLRSDQKAAAVNLGIFPTTTQPSYAYVAPPRVAVPAPPTTQPPPAPRQPAPSTSGAAAGDRLTTIDQVLRPSPSAAPPPVQVANVPPQSRPAGSSASAPVTRPRVWVQLASGSNPDALPEQFRRMKSRHRELFEGISGYVAESADRSRLLIGPFRSVSDANIFIEDLESVSVDAFSWTSPPGQLIRKLPSE